MKVITVHELKDKIHDDKSVYLLDVRQPFEQYQSDIEYENSTLIPHDRLENCLNEIEADKEDEIVCMCRSGGRSAEACKLLEKEGFKNVKTLKGGINQWAREINNKLPIY